MVSKKIISSNQSKGLGDILILTAVCKILNGVDEIHLNPGVQQFKLFFDGICNNIIITKTPYLLKDIGEGHFIERKLRNFLSDDQIPKEYYPQINVKNDDNLKWAKSIQSQYEKPILIFHPNCSLPWKYKKEYGNKADEYFTMQQIINFLSKKFTIIQTGLSSNFTKYNNVIEMKDLPLGKLISLYYISGRYLGSDTGDFHLMLAVGGKTLVLHPIGKLGDDLLKDWGYRGIRYKRLLFSEINNIYKDNFLL